MPNPTTAVYFSESFPAAPDGNQLCVPQTDGAVPQQSVTFYPQVATADLLGVVKPGPGLAIDEDGALSVTSVGSTPGGGGPSASNGALVCVVPSGAKDGSNLQYMLPAPVLAGNDPLYFRNGIKQRQLGTKAEFSIQGTQLTVAPSPITQPLQSDDWHELHYVMGTPNSESGGSGGVAPIGPASLRGTGSGAASSGSSVIIPFPSGTQVGDLVVILVGSPSNPGVPSGWATNYTEVTINWFAIVCSKVMTSADISAGSVTVSWSGSFFNTYQVATFIGPTNGIRETDGLGAGTITTSSAVEAGDVALYFGSARSEGNPNVCSVNRGIMEQQVIDGTNWASSCLYAESIASAGAVTASFSTTFIGAYVQNAIVIVKGS